MNVVDLFIPSVISCYPTCSGKSFVFQSQLSKVLEKFISFPPQIHKFNNNDWSLYHGGGQRGFCFLWRLAVWGRAWAKRSDTVLTDALQALLMGQHFHLCFPNVWWMVVLIVFLCMWWYPRGRLTWPSLNRLIIWELLWTFFWLLSSWWVDVQQSQPFLLPETLFSVFTGLASSHSPNLRGLPWPPSVILDPIIFF